MKSAESTFISRIPRKNTPPLRDNSAEMEGGVLFQGFARSDPKFDLPDAVFPLRNRQKQGPKSQIFSPAAGFLPCKIHISAFENRIFFACGGPYPLLKYHPIENKNPPLKLGSEGVRYLHQNLGFSKW